MHFYLDFRVRQKYQLIHLKNCRHLVKSVISISSLEKRVVSSAAKYFLSLIYPLYLLTYLSPLNKHVYNLSFNLPDNPVKARGYLFYTPGNRLNERSNKLSLC